LRRNRLNLTQPELAESSGVSPRSISDYERGLSLPSFEHLQKLSGALGIGIGWLLGEDELPASGMVLHDAPARDPFDEFWDRLQALNLAAEKLRPKFSSEPARRGKFRSAAEAALADLQEDVPPHGASPR